MQQIDTIQLATNGPTIFKRLVNFFVGPRISTPQPGLLTIDVDWPGTDSGAKQSYYESDNRLVSGGYNEAFVVQHWVSYRLS